jgi:hypothetical protein
MNYLNPLCMRVALQFIVDRHPSLRTVFKEIDGVPMQVVRPSSRASRIGRKKRTPNVDVDFEVIKVEGSQLKSYDSKDPDAHHPTALKQLIIKHSHKPFDIINGPVFRARYLLLTDSSGAPLQSSTDGAICGVLHLMASHIAVDGWSMEVLVDELLEGYNNLMSKNASFFKSSTDTSAPCDLPPFVPETPVFNKTPTNMITFARYQREFLNGVEGNRSWSFWQRTLTKPLPILNLQTDIPRPPTQKFAGAVHRFFIPLSLSYALRTLATKQRCTMFMVLISSWFTLLNRYTGEEDIIVGTPMACRNLDEELETAVGNFVNPVVIRAQLTSDPSLNQVLDHVKRATIAAFTNQNFPFPELVNRLENHRDPSRNPIFQVGRGLLLFK